MSTVQEATEASTKGWQQDLHSLFLHTKDRFPDVVWDFTDSEEIWGHKAIVYARAPPSFQSRYFQSPNRSYESQLSLPDPDVSRSPSPAPTQLGQLLRLHTDINPTLFSNELEYLYTGQGFGEAFEFLFDSTELSRTENGDAEELRIDKLRKDLVFMWRSRLYSDVRIVLSGTFSSTNHEESTALFSSHRFILASRCDYFHTALIGWPSPQKPLSSSTSSDQERELPTLTLPSPPFTPASLHFTLGYIYTGTLVFSHRSYDLDTAFAILRSSLYLSMSSLHAEAQARIVQEMMHGLFHAPLDFTAYEQITGGKWGTGGCRCRQCARRAPRVLEFAFADDVKNLVLDRGARRALVGLFGEGWCTSEFASLQSKLKDNLLKGVNKRTTPLNAFLLLFAAEKALQKLDRVKDVWAENVREYIINGRRAVDECLCNYSEQCFGSFGESGEGEGQQEWTEIMQNDGVRFEDPERIEWIMAAVKRGINDKNAAVVYQTLVSSILLRPHPTDPSQAMLNSGSPIKAKVEETRLHILQYLRKRWINVRNESGFDDVEGWAVKEISDYIEVPYEDLLIPVPVTNNKQSTRNSTLKTRLDGESDVASSMRVSILSRNLPKSTAGSVRDDRSIRSGFSVRNGADSRSVRSGVSHSTLGRRSVTPTGRDRPDSKLSSPKRPIPPPPEVVVQEEPEEEDDEDVEEVEVKSTPPPNSVAAALARPSSSASVRSSTAPSVKSSAASVRSSAASIRSSAASVRSTVNRKLPSVSSPPRKSMAPTVDKPRSSSASVRSTAASIRSNATVRKSSGASSHSLKPPTPKVNSRRPSSSASTISRPESSLSTTSSSTTAGTSTAFKTATERSRTTSTGSVGSTRSTNTTTTNSRSTTASRTPVSPASKRAPSIASSVRSSVSTISTRSPRVTVKKTSTPGVPRSPSLASVKGKGKEKEETAPPVPKNPAVIVLKGKARAEARTVKRKGSGDTITGSVPPSPATPVNARLPSAKDTPAPMDTDDPTPLGATLSIGIPCIISSNRKRFRALARYIGEVDGEVGPWVGVEVPSESLTSSSTLSTQWNDGTLRGIRYFTISPGEFDDLERDNKGKRGTKRGASALSPGTGAGREKRLRSTSPADASGGGGGSRGLFVRPQQVLYVVDAIDGDL